MRRTEWCRGEVIYAKGDVLGKRLADIIARRLKEFGQTGVTEYTKEQPDGKPWYGIIRETKATSVIVEPAFLDNPVDRLIIDTPEEQRAVGVLESKSICELYGIAYVPEYISPVVPEPIIVPEPPKEVKHLEALNFEESLQLLKERFGIDPEHWRQANESVKYIEELFIKIANTIK